MKHIEFDEEKCKRLKKERGVSFEKVSLAIYRNGFIGIIDNPNKQTKISETANVLSQYKRIHFYNSVCRRCRKDFSKDNLFE